MARSETKQVIVLELSWEEAKALYNLIELTDLDQVPLNNSERGHIDTVYTVMEDICNG